MENRKIRTEKDRETTEQSLLRAIGELVAEEGFERLGVNAVAARAGVSKVLIYRYFESLDGLIAAYIRTHDFWIDYRPELPKKKHLGIFLKQMFRSQIERLRSDTTLKRLYRWELSGNNAQIAELRSQREATGLWLVESVSQLTGRPRTEVAVLATLISASVSYLALLEESCPTYNGLPLQQPAGWETYAAGIDSLIDQWIATFKNKSK